MYRTAYNLLKPESTDSLFSEEFFAKKNGTFCEKCHAIHIDALTYVEDDDTRHTMCLDCIPRLPDQFGVERAVDSHGNILF